MSENPAFIPTLGGQIVRIYLENFMTHNSVEVRPGYHLNMIIGPNGTGKSTIVCAVVLGLGGKLKTLGRADHLSSYVKSGCEQSLIEIELYNPDKDNIIVKRIITSANQSQFYINDVPSTAAKVADIRSKFNIQIDNLCTFLPQEKVQDFAKMNPQELLEHTQKTVGHGELLEQHENLKALRRESLNYRNEKETLESSLNILVAKNERLAPKVEAIKEKQSHCDKIILLNQKKHWLLYHEAVEDKNAVEEDIRLAKGSVVKKEKHVNKALLELKTIEDNSKAQQDAFFVAEREESAKKDVVSDRLDRLQQRIDRLSDLDVALKDRLNEESKKKMEIANSDSVLNKLRIDCLTYNETNKSDEELKERDKNIQEKLMAAPAVNMTLVRKQEKVEEENRALEQELRGIDDERQLLENARSQRLEYLRTYESDVYKSVKWLEQNQQLFRGKVYNPMLLELEVNDPKYAAVVEATIPYNDLIAFSVMYSDDLNTLVQNLRVQMKLRVNIVTVEAGNLAEALPSVPIDQLQQYGFHSYVISFISGPPPIIQYLCRNYRINNIPVGDRRVENADSIPGSIKKYFSDQHVFTVNISSYSKEKSTTVRRLTDAKFFNTSVDKSKLLLLKTRANEIRIKLESSKLLINEYNHAMAYKRKTMDELRQERREILMKIEERANIFTQCKRALDKYESLKKELRDPKTIEEDINREKKALESALDRLLTELKKAHQALKDSYHKRLKASLCLKMCRVGIGEIQQRLHESKDALVKANDALRLVEDRYRTVEIECERAREAARQLTEGYCPGNRKFQLYADKFQTLSDSIVELEKELAATQARADFLDGGSAQVLIEFTKQEEEIKKLKELMSSNNDKNLLKLKDIEILRAQWLAPINQLVKTVDVSFGEHFANMGCAGEVVLQVPDDENDFDGYGVKIRVKFHDSVPLQDLSRHFQSGGERAVSTAIYMISLQNLTNVPFRFVDEINQGMDPANERRITDLIISVTAPIDSQQYFFITPKLMTDLVCPDTMTVLCVYNGPSGIPSTEWDVEKFERLARNIADG